MSVLLFTGCGAKGQQFTEFAKPKPNEGLVYVYRPKSLVGGGVYYDIKCHYLSRQLFESLSSNL
jgi:hypothetical protein